MVVRIVTYGAESLETAEAWARQHAEDLRGAAGVERVTFIRSREPPRVGAVMVFTSVDALARYKQTGPFRRIVDSLRRLWGAGSEPVREQTYHVLEV